MTFLAEAAVGGRLWQRSAEMASRGVVLADQGLIGRVLRSADPVELEHVVRCADQRPLRTHFLQAAQQEPLTSVSFEMAPPHPT